MNTRTLFICSILCAVPALAAAQSSRPAASVFGGVAIASVSETGTRETHAGWMTAVVVPVSRSWSLVGEYDRIGWSVDYSSLKSRVDRTISSLGGGARVGFGVFYLQVLAGRRSSGTTNVHLSDGSSFEITPDHSFMVQSGVGLQAPLGRLLVFRLQGDWRTGPWGKVYLSSHNVESEMLNDFQAVAGIGIKFSRR